MCVYMNAKENNRLEKQRTRDVKKKKSDALGKTNKEKAHVQGKPTKWLFRSVVKIYTGSVRFHCV